jgi:hypothetical protein
VCTLGCDALALVFGSALCALGLRGLKGTHVITAALIVGRRRSRLLGARLLGGALLEVGGSDGATALLLCD